MEGRNKISLIALLAFIALFLGFPSISQAIQGGTHVCHLGVAPLLGNCPDEATLISLANRNQNLVRSAVLEAGGNQDMADEVVRALTLGQFQAVTVPGRTQLRTMAWYGTSSSGAYGLHTLWNPVLDFPRPVDCWQIQITIKTKTVFWLLPKRCGNLSLWKIEWHEEVVIRTPQPTPPPPQVRLYIAQDVQRSTIEKGGEVYKGSTSSGFSFAVIPKSPDINVTQNGGGANVKSSSSSAASSSSSSSASNQNNISNTNLNNNSAISQSQNVVPVNVVVNTGPGNASGTSTGSGNQDAGATQNNGP